ncbi:glycine betaine ABC transporter substrate-binding protein, partial [Burkholderia gladioli]|nr:glycine betaine ABC transporter substrate-binding protein [Burkholderia gladioli]
MNPSPTPRLAAFSLLALAAFGPVLPAQAAAPIVVSSKIDTEGSLLGQLIAQSLKAHGLAVTDKISLGTTPIVRKALTTGEIDIYPEYTGNAAFFFNKADDPLWRDAARGYAAARQLDYQANHLVWLTPAPATAQADETRQVDPRGIVRLPRAGRLGGRLRLLDQQHRQPAGMSRPRPLHADPQRRRDDDGAACHPARRRGCQPG